MKIFINIIIYIINFLLIYNYTYPINAEEKIHRQIISIDLDGVLNNYTGKYNQMSIPQMNIGAKEFVTKLYEKYDLILFTTRSTEQAQNWLIQNNLDKYFIQVTNIKQPSYIYIDDRALKFNGNYSKTIKDINKFKVHWNK